MENVISTIQGSCTKAKVMAARTQLDKYNVSYDNRVLKLSQSQLDELKADLGEGTEGEYKCQDDSYVGMIYGFKVIKGV